MDRPPRPDFPTIDRSRRRALQALAGGAAAFALAGCTEPVVPLRVGSIVFPGYELLFLAREQGPLDTRLVRLIEMSANTDIIRSLAVDHLEAAALTLDEVLSARDGGVDLRVIAVLDVSAGSDVVLARPGIRSAADLVGRRVGVEAGAVGAVMLGALLEAAGLNARQLRLQPMVLNESVAVFDSGQVDAIVTAEPWAGILEARGAHRIFDSRAIPGRIVDVLAVRPEAARRWPDALRHLVAAHLDALARFQRDPALVSRAMAPRLQLTPEEVPRAFQGLELPDAVRNRELMGEAGPLRQGAHALQRAMKDSGLLQREQDLDDLIDPSFLPGG